MHVEGVRDSYFMGPYSAIISDIFDYVGTFVGILIEFCFSRVFKQNLVYRYDLFNYGFHVRCLY